MSVPSAAVPGVARFGMIWIPAGVLHAGSALDEVPRVAAAELPGVDVALGAFYIDVLPWPNEAGAIPTTNVTRDEAERLCASKRKRLCTELEWERACKGPDNWRYEYGADYDPRVCGIDGPRENAARRPSGERVACRSAFAVHDMHGGAWEWTGSRWGRGSARELGVVRGGSDAEGELSSRCAHGRSLALSERSAATGLRCCGGPKNDAEVNLEVTVGRVLERVVRGTSSPPLEALGGRSCGPPQAPTPCWVSRAWTWRPAPNVELSLAGGCTGRWPRARCGLAVSRRAGDRADLLAQVDTGQETPEVVFASATSPRVRMRGTDARGRFVREVVFSYGRVEVRPAP